MFHKQAPSILTPTIETHISAAIDGATRDAIDECVRSLCTELKLTSGDHFGFELGGINYYGCVRKREFFGPSVSATGERVFSVYMDVDIHD